VASTKTNETELAKISSVVKDTEELAVKWILLEETKVEIKLKRIT
jgi:hypothetical protein